MRPSDLLDPHRKHFETDLERMLFDFEFITSRETLPSLDGSVTAEIMRKRELQKQGVMYG